MGLGILRTVAAALALCVLAAGAGAQDDDDSYRLEIGDQIAVSVLEDPGLNASLLVRPDGRISLPLVGDLAVAGRTPEAVAANIRRILARNFVEPPTVTVSLVAVGGIVTPLRIYVLGEVARPGVYELEEPVHILQALALAGGPSPFAAISRIQLRDLRDTPGEVILFDYALALDGATPVQSLFLDGGEVLIVPVRGLFE